MINTIIWGWLGEMCLLQYGIEGVTSVIFNSVRFRFRVRVRVLEVELELEF